MVAERKLRGDETAEWIMEEPQRKMPSPETVSHIGPGPGTRD